MYKNRFAKRVAVAVGFLFLFALPGLTRAQSSPPSPLPTPRKTLPAARPKTDTPPVDPFAGLQYTAEQQARIDQIHKDMKSRMDVVVKNETLSPEQKGAMLDGYQRMERAQVYKVLTSEQQLEVRKKILAERAAEQQRQQPQQPQKQALPK